MALDATYGGEAAVSYVSDAAAALVLCDVFDAMPFLGVSTTAFRALAEASDETNAEAVLRFAAMRIDGLDFDGDRATEGQSREFPRINLTRLRGDEYSPDAVAAPLLIRQAQVGEACVLASAPDPAQGGASAARTVQSESLGGHSRTFATTSGQQDVAASRRASASIEAMLRSAGALRGRITSVSVPRA